VKIDKSLFRTAPNFKRKRKILLKVEESSEKGKKITDYFNKPQKLSQEEKNLKSALENKEKTPQILSP